MRRNYKATSVFEVVGSQRGIAMQVRSGQRNLSRGFAPYAVLRSVATGVAMTVAIGGSLGSLGCKKDAAPTGGGGSQTAPSGATSAQPVAASNAIRIGVLTDMSGLYADLAGQGSVVAAKM